MTEILRDDCSSLDKWVVTGSPATIVAARNGNGFQLGSSTAFVTTYFPGLYESDTVVVGFAYRRIDTTATIRELVRFYSDVGGTEHNRLRWTLSSTTLEFTRGTTVLASNASVSFTQNTWYYIEVKTVLHTTTGSVVVRINGTEVINATGLNTKNAGTKTTYDAVMLRQGAVSGGGNQYDDFYLKAGSGETFLGDPGAVTTTATVMRSARLSTRVATSPYIDAGVAMGRHSLRVAVDPLTPEPAGRAKVWTGAAWVLAPVKVWNGTAFVNAVAVKTWNGTAWADAL